MKNQPQPTIRSGEHLPHFDGTNDHLFFTREFWNKMIAVSRGILATRDWRVTENGILTENAGTGTGTVKIAGEWDPAQSYEAQTIVCFTPDGEAAATFYSVIKVPAGISPDTGAPYWAAFPMSPAGLWG
jgi:hypothetical protein